MKHAHVLSPECIVSTQSTGNSGNVINKVRNNHFVTFTIIYLWEQSLTTGLVNVRTFSVFLSLVVSFQFIIDTQVKGLPNPGVDVI